MATLLHTADTHLGYRQYHRPEREADFREAFYHVIDAGIDEGVDAVVHAGDLFDSSRPGIEALSDALEGLKRLREANVPFLSIVGNHDGTRDRQWLDVFASLGLATRLDSSGFSIQIDGPSGSIEGGTDGLESGSGENENGCRIVLYGLDYVERGRRDRLDYSFDPASAKGADATVLVAHGLFEPFPNGDWDARAICRQSTVGFDAILAGDDHTRQETVLEEFGTLLTYPGSTERTAADQREPRGYDLVEIDVDGGIDLEHRELDTREFVYVDVGMEDGDGPDRVLEALEVEGNEEETDFTDAVVVVTLTGVGERVSSGPIEEFGLARGALTVRVNDRREFDDELREYGEVAFADPESAAEKRRETLGLSENGREIEELVRDTEAIPDSNVTDAVEDRVRDWLDERPIEAFERTDPEPADESTPARFEESEKATTGPDRTATNGAGENETGADTAEPTTGSRAAVDGKSPADDTGTGESRSDGSAAIAPGPDTEGSSSPKANPERRPYPEDLAEVGADPETETGEEPGTEGDETDRSETEEESGGEEHRNDEQRTTQSTLWD